MLCHVIPDAVFAAFAVAERSLVCEPIRRVSQPLASDCRRHAHPQTISDVRKNGSVAPMCLWLKFCWERVRCDESGMPELQLNVSQLWFFSLSPKVLTEKSPIWSLLIICDSNHIPHVHMWSRVCHVFVAVFDCQIYIHVLLFFLPPPSMEITSS